MIFLSTFLGRIMRMKHDLAQEFTKFVKARP
jgi:hypothetical protein